MRSKWQIRSDRLYGGLSVSEANHDPLQYTANDNLKWADLWLLHPTLNNVAKMTSVDVLLLLAQGFFC